MTDLLIARNRPMLLLAALLLVMAAILTRPLISQANATVTVFQIRSFAPIVVPAGTTVPGAKHFLSPTAGKETEKGTTAVRPVADLAAAQAAVGFAPRLPSGVGAPAGIVVSTPRTQTHTFTAAEVDKALAGAHVQAPTVAALLDGSTAALDLPAAVGVFWGSAKHPSLALLEGPSPSLTLTGVSAETIRQALLDAQGQPAPIRSITQQLLAINDWQHTLPVPVPATATTSTPALANGAHGLLVTETRQGKTDSLLLWQRDNLVYALGEQGTAYNLVALAGTIH